MTPRAASRAEIEIIRACISFAHEKGTTTDPQVDGEDCWGRDEYKNENLLVQSSLFFYAPVVGFFALRVEENGLLVLDASGCVDISTVSVVLVFEHIPGPWENKVFLW